MKANFKKAFNELQRMGAPVYEGGWNGEDTFRISGEDNYDADKNFYLWADYYAMDYGDFGVNPEITKVLDKFGLFAEWVNPGVLSVYNQ